MSISCPWHLMGIGGAGLLLEPGEGLDPAAGLNYMEAITEVLLASTACYLYYDVKGVAVIDTVYYEWLLQLDRGCQLLGVTLVILQMRPETAFALSRTLMGAIPFCCARSLDAPWQRPEGFSGRRAG